MYVSRRRKWAHYHRLWLLTCQIITAAAFSEIIQKAWRSSTELLLELSSSWTEIKSILREPKAESLKAGVQASSFQLVHQQSVLLSVRLSLVVWALFSVSVVVGFVLAAPWVLGAVCLRGSETKHEGGREADSPCKSKYMESLLWFTSL